MVQRFALKIAYDGENYRGFQRQIEGILTVEGEIIATLKKLKIFPEEKKARYSAAGRTDAGVSAIGQVIAFDSPREKIYLEEINRHLPEDIIAWGVSTVPEEFNARRDAKLRTYHYYKRYEGEDLLMMKKALKKMTGTHDFKKLSKKDRLPNGQEKSTILTMDKAKVEYLKNKNLLRFQFTSRSFLWHQVRKMTSLIIDIGKKDKPFESVDLVLNPEKPRLKGGIKPMPSEGLVLYEVKYDALTFEPITQQSIIERRIAKKINTTAAKLALLELMKESIL